VSWFYDCLIIFVFCRNSEMIKKFESDTKEYENKIAASQSKIDELQECITNYKESVELSKKELEQVDLFKAFV